MKLLLSLTIFLLFFPICFPSSLAAEKTTVNSHNKQAWVQAAIDHYVKNQDVPAIAVSLVENGRLSKVLTSGSTNRQTGQAISSDTQFQIASLSKIFTGILARRLISEGLIQPQHKVLDYLPDELAPATRQKLQEVTIRHLLQHHSGLPRDSQVVAREGNDPMLSPLSESGLLKDLVLADMIGPAGEQYEYSNLGYGLLGYLMERASGKPYAELVHQFITLPHQLTDTGVSLSASQQQRLATPYSKDDGFIPTKTWQTGKLTPASGLYSTPSDLGRLMALQISAYRDSKDEKFLLTEDLAPVSEGRFYGYGMNKMTIEIEGQSKTFLFHSGDMDGFAATYMWLTDTGNGAVLLTSRGGKWKSEFQSLLFRKIADLPVELPKAG